MMIHGPMPSGPARSVCGEREKQPRESRDKLTSNWERVTCAGCLLRVEDVYRAADAVVDDAAEK